MNLKKMTNRMLLPLSLVSLVCLGALCGCATSSSRFEKISPGMTADQVKTTMSDGPSRFETASDTGYASWYWGEDYCVLFRNDRVVSKNTATDGMGGEVKGVGYQEKNKASCLAPGQTARSGTERSINVPGVGTIRLPNT
jgi:hypothetical protein